MIGNKKTVFRLGSFDLLKGMGAILFIISHTYSRYAHSESEIFHILLYALLLPGLSARAAFYLIGGMTFRETTPKKMLKKTFRSLIIPYLWVMAAYGILFPLVRYPFMPSWREVFTYAIRYVAAFLLGNLEYGKVIFGFEIYWCTPMYFFLSMFIAMNLLNLILKNKNRYVQILCVTLCVMVGNWFLFNNMTLFSLSSGLPAVGVYYVGYILGQSGLFRKLQCNKWSYVVCGIGFLLGLEFANIGGYTYFLNLLIWITNLLGSLLLIFISDYITEKEWGGLGWLKKIGLYSYWIICIHSFETEAIPWFLYVAKFPTQHLWFAFILEMLIKTVIISTCCLMLKQITKFRYKRKLMMQKTHT